jgi:glyoxylase-like metal-dependent hydrolase (beta-lactamase superfamily II)
MVNAMYFRQILHEDHSCASYLIGCPTLGVCAVVDPQGDIDRYIDEVENNAMVICAVVETHLHADHLSSARTLATASGAPLYLGPDAGVTYPHHVLRDGDVLEIGNRRMKALHTPGHTPEHLCLLVDDWFVLTGDTLFVGDVGRVDLSENPTETATVAERADQLFASLQRLLELPDWVEVYPGHYAGSTCGRGMDGKTISTIGRERRMNPLLCLDPPEFQRTLTTNLPPLPENFVQIKKFNIGIVETPEAKHLYD